MDLHPIQLVEFDWSNAFNRQCNLNGFTSKFDRSNAFNRQSNLNGFTPNLTRHLLLVKLGRNSLRLHHHLMKINTKLHNTQSEVDLASKSTDFIKLLHF